MFGLNQYRGPDGCVHFQTNYPDALIEKWESSHRDYWFTSAIWNALIARSYNYSDCSGLVILSMTWGRSVDISNTDVGYLVTFSVCSLRVTNIIAVPYVGVAISSSVAKTSHCNMVGAM